MFYEGQIWVYYPLFPIYKYNEEACTRKWFSPYLLDFFRYVFISLFRIHISLSYAKFHNMNYLVFFHNETVRKHASATHLNVLKMVSPTCQYVWSSLPQIFHADSYNFQVQEFSRHPINGK